jgi:hypothetical protein
MSETRTTGPYDVASSKGNLGSSCGFREYG